MAGATYGTQASDFDHWTKVYLSPSGRPPVAVEAVVQCLCSLLHDFEIILDQRRQRRVPVIRLAASLKAKMVAPSVMLKKLSGHSRRRIGPRAKGIRGR